MSDVSSRRNTAACPGSSRPLVDNYGRSVTYLRLAITDRCNLRCRYCMPEQGVTPMSHEQTLSYEELERLIRVFLGLGIVKVRITGGEPFARRGCVEFLRRLKTELGVPHLFLTTNGVETARYLGDLKEIGVSGINLSLDTLDRNRFREISRRDKLDQVLLTLHRALELEIPVKLNCVVMEETDDQDVVGLGELVRKHALSLRFIEKMPFSGDNHAQVRPGTGLRERLERLFPGLTECPSDTISTARLFSAPGLVGTIGLIEGNSRRFCATCNKVRITPQGQLKACLYDDGVLDLRAMVRSGATDGDIARAVRRCLNERHADGHAAEAALGAGSEPSMATIGG